MDLSYFQKINNTYHSKSRQETDLFLLNRQVNYAFSDTIDYQKVLKNGKPFELLVIKDTDGNTYKKKIKSRPGQYINLGDYIYWNNQYWLITLIDYDDKTYNSGYMYLCTILLSWQNNNGDIVQRWAYSEDFTKYSAGIQGTTIITGDFQYGITLPVDEETRLLKRDRRFAIDLDGVDIPDIYKITNRKVKLTDASYFNRGSVVNFTLSYDSFNDDTDKLITIDSVNNKTAWICDYIKKDSSQQQIVNNSILLEITCSSPSVRFGGGYRTFKGIFHDSNGNVINDKIGQWTVNSLFNNSYLSIDTSVNNQIKIKVNTKDDSIVGMTFNLTFSYQNSMVVLPIVVEN